MLLFPTVGELYQLMLGAGMGTSHSQNLISRVKLASWAASGSSDPLDWLGTRLKKLNYSDLKRIIEFRGFRNSNDSPRRIIVVVT